ncbi:MAG: hypothetical protein K2W82_18305 [Candidatus Obscuribacterales bacterium]|nr:hypothetical protein [Candidatus Obscuribacterales bacterium]
MVALFVSAAQAEESKPSPTERQKEYAAFKEKVTVACDVADATMSAAELIVTGIDLSIEDLRDVEKEYAQAKKDGDKTKMNAVLEDYQSRVNLLRDFRSVYSKKIEKSWNGLFACDFEPFDAEFSTGDDYQLVKRALRTTRAMREPIFRANGYLEPLEEKCKKIATAKGIDPNTKDKDLLKEIGKQAAGEVLEQRAGIILRDLEKK